MAPTVLTHAQLEPFHSLIKMEQLDAKLAQRNSDLSSQEINAFPEQQPPPLLQPQE
jgi:hypothetical protein